MEFIVITVAIMTISSLVIYKLLQFGGVKINMQPLILCGILALLVNFSAIAISSYLTTTHFIMLGVLVLIAAASATWYNHWIDIRNSYPVPAVLIHGDAADDIPTDEEHPLDDEEENEVIPEFVRDTEVDSDSRVLSTEFIYDTPPASTDNVVDINEENSSTENAAGSEEQAELNEPIADEPEQSVDDAEPVEDETEQPTDDAEPIEDEAEQSVDDAEPVENEAVQPIDEVKSATDEVEQPTDEDEPAAEQSIDETEPVENEPEPVPASSISDDVVAAVAAMETLDDLLDYAFEEKTLHHDDNSLYASAEALRRYRDDSYAPFVAIDMINICKARGDYQRTMEIYQDALSLPAVKESREMQQEFLSGMTYISCIVDILDKNGQQHVPVSEIPKHIMEEIEKTYSSRKNNP